LMMRMERGVAVIVLYAALDVWQITGRESETSRRVDPASDRSA